MPDSHAKLSPSAASRWMTCPGSVVLSEFFPEQTSPYAKEGTLAHAMAEAWLQGVYQLVSPSGDPTVNEMQKHVQVYVEHVGSLRRIGPSNKVYVEVKVSVSEHIWGTADAIVWDPDTFTLYVRDLKYGAGTAVEVSDNHQLKMYALAALLTMKLPAKVVNVGIVQPRLPHADGFIRTKDYDAVDLIDFHADVADAEHRIKEAFFEAEETPCREWNEKFLCPSEKGCKWCLAAPTCPKLKSRAQELAKQVFAPGLPYDPKALAATLDFLPILSGWIENVRKFAYTEAEKGNPIPSYKLVPKVASRKWPENINVKALAAAVLIAPEELYDKAPLKNVTTIQKMAPGKNDDERAAVIAPFVVKESSGHTLVHESDKRDAIRVDAKAVFA